MQAQQIDTQQYRPIDKSASPVDFVIIKPNGEIIIKSNTSADAEYKMRVELGARRITLPLYLACTRNQRVLRRMDPIHGGYRSIELGAVAGARIYAEIVLAPFRQIQGD